MSGGLRDRNMNVMIKGKMFVTVFRRAMLYGNTTMDMWSYKVDMIRN